MEARQDLNASGLSLSAAKSGASPKVGAGSKLSDGLLLQLVAASARAATIAGDSSQPVRGSWLVAHAPNPKAFSTGRNLATWIGPKQDTATCAMLTVDALAAVALVNEMARMV